MGRQAMFNKIASHGGYIIDEILKDVNSRNPSVRSAALKMLISKILPDLKATEISGEGGGALRIIIQDYGHSNNPPAETTGSNPEE